MKRVWLLVIFGVILVPVFALPGLSKASGLAAGSRQEVTRAAGVASNTLKCLAVGGDSLPAPASGVVDLSWQGRVERARLIVTLAGTEAEHTIRVNGRPVAVTPIYAEGQICGEGHIFYLDIAPAALVQGENTIELTGSALPGDTWSASSIRLEVLGDLEIPQPAEIGPAGVSAAATNFTFIFTNLYDNSSQEARGTIPAGCSSPMPLLIAVHPRSGDMYFGEDTFGAAIIGRCWLMASPQLHGRSDIAPDDPPDPPGQRAYASLESQYDALGVIKYMVENYSVDVNRIYLAGYSMGGQGVVVTAAKFPHLFAAVFDNKGPTDMDAWYWEQVNYYGSQNHNQIQGMRRECYVGEDPNKLPAYPANSLGLTPTNPFCYERRSGLRFAGNFIHLPISMTHSIDDLLVPIHHSRDLRDAVNGYSPDWPAALYEDPYALDPDTGLPCTSNYHCFVPDPEAVLNFLQQFTLNNTPTRIDISSDLSKSYYWLNITQTGGEHWTKVQANYATASQTVDAVVTDPSPVTLGFNLGASPIAGDLAQVPQPGMGLPATTYLVKIGSSKTLQNYAAGYFNVSVPAGTNLPLTISALQVQVGASPGLIPAEPTATSLLTVLVKDRLNNPAPDGTVVTFTTSKGTLANGGIAQISGGLGQATMTLTAAPTPGTAQVVVGVGLVTAATTVHMGNPDYVYLPFIVKMP